MGFKAGAQGVNTKGKTKGKNLGNSGPSIGVETGPATKSGGGKKNADMKTMGRNLAKVKNQKGR
jgi:hypothetical protein